MIKLKIKTGDIVRVIAGDHKGAEGKVYVLTVRKQSCC
jgi:large subunit ribosomal protein L24